MGSGPKFCSDGTTSPPIDSPCCSTIQLTSSGAIANSAQNHVLGTYQLVGEGPAGHYNYQQTMGDRRKLYYMDWLSMWYIGNNFGENLAFALYRSTEQCPENLGSNWEYYDFENTDDWAPDPTAT